MHTVMDPAVSHGRLSRFRAASRNATIDVITQITEQISLAVEHGMLLTIRVNGVASKHLCSTKIHVQMDRTIILVVFVLTICGLLTGCRKHGSR